MHETKRGRLAQRPPRDDSAGIDGLASAVRRSGSLQVPGSRTRGVGDRTHRLDLESSCGAMRSAQASIAGQFR